MSWAKSEQQHSTWMSRMVVQSLGLSYMIVLCWYLSIFFLSSSSFFFLKQGLIQYSLTTIYPPASTSQVLRFQVWAAMPDWCLHFNSIPLTLSLYVMNRDLFLSYTLVHDQYDLVEQAQVDLTCVCLLSWKSLSFQALACLGCQSCLRGEHATWQRMCWCELEPFMPCWYMPWDSLLHWVLQMQMPTGLGR